MLANELKSKLHGTSKRDQLTGVVSVDKDTSIVRVLNKCSDFKNEQAYLKFILDLLGVDLRITLKYHGIGSEYACDYSKLRFRREFNDAIAGNV